MCEKNHNFPKTERVIIGDAIICCWCFLCSKWCLFKKAAVLLVLQHSNKASHSNRTQPSLRDVAPVQKVHSKHSTLTARNTGKTMINTNKQVNYIPLLKKKCWKERGGVKEKARIRGWIFFGLSVPHTQTERPQAPGGWSDMRRLLRWSTALINIIRGGRWMFKSHRQQIDLLYRAEDEKH